MSRLDTSLPEELAHVPRPVLESYVRTRVLALAGSPSVSRRLGLSSDVVKQAFIDAIMEGQHPRGLPNAERDDPAVRLQLVFRHDCLSLGCLDQECSLCAQNPHRRCEGNFSGKYLAGDVLKAKCGASIRVEVVDRATAESVTSADALADIRLEMAILDGKEYASLQDGRDNTEEEVTKCILLTNNQHKELLQPGRGGSITEGKLVNVPINRAQAYLPDLVVTGSSEALLSGQKPPFRLFVRAVHMDGTRASHIRFAVSEAFVVATPRVRTAAKADIPHVDDHVKMLAGLGNQTQQKLMDIQAAASAVGVFGLTLPHNTVTKVGQFKDLIELADRDRVLCDTLKKVLKLTKGWDAAREHAMSAVGTDNQMRIWYQDDAMLGGLLFKCNLGCIDLDSPVGLLTKREASGDQTTLEATLMAQLDASQRETLRKLQREASLSWWQPGHPGWAIWPVDSDSFMKGAQAQGPERLPKLDSPPPPRVPSSRLAEFLRTYGRPDMMPATLPATLPHDSYAQAARPRHEHNNSFGGFPAIPGTSGGGSMDRDHSLDGMGFPFSNSGVLLSSNIVQSAPSWIMPGTERLQPDPGTASRGIPIRQQPGVPAGPPSGYHHHQHSVSADAIPLASPFGHSGIQDASPAAGHNMYGEEAAAAPPAPLSPFETTLVQPRGSQQALAARTGNKRRPDELSQRPSAAPEAPKRQHVNLPQLQQRLSQLVGRPLTDADMSKITGLTNFQELSANDYMYPLSGAELTPADLPGMNIARGSAYNQAGDMPGPSSSGQQQQNMSQLLLDTLSLPGLSLEFNNLGNLGHLDSAVAMLHETGPADNVLQQRRSSVLVNFVDTRLGAPESHIIGGGMGSAPMQTDARVPAPPSQGQNIFAAQRLSQQGTPQLTGQRMSGLDTMHSIGEALNDP
ncbi:hypothetical protein WJX73_001816 [Symbiochloris irregularis]|uniref:Uncharacterized protein n=1 Tax=Symbiochloris irregularis TaxID=706552 RepID=A0AAW1NQ01_9CHLO